MINAIGDIIGRRGVTESGGGVPWVFSEEYIAIQTYANSNTIDLPTQGGQQVDDQLIKDLIAAGLWGEIDAMWQFTTEGITTYSLINQKTPGTSNATLHGTVIPSYVAKEGFHGNSAQSAYINFNWTPSTDGINFIQNDASFHVYTLTSDFGAALTPTLIGTTNGSAVGRLVLGVEISGNSSGYLNSNSGVSGAAESAGLHSIVRSSSANHQLYLNGIQTGTDTDVSNGVSNFPLIGFGLNEVGTPNRFSDGHLGLVIVGSSSITPSTLNTIWNNHLARIAALT